MKNIYDQDSFFKAYAQMPRSREGLGGAGEWYQQETLFLGEHVMMHLPGMKEEMRRPMMLLIKAGKAGGDFGSCS